MTKLDEILTYKRAELEITKKARSLIAIAGELELARSPNDFLAALRCRGTRPALVAECKRASPSRGLLVKEINAIDLARTYAENGASAVSVLTDRHFFHGSLDDLRRISGAGLKIPVLRKDFILDAYQVYEARAAGADAVLLIVAVLGNDLLRELHELVRRLGMTALIEVHDREEIEIALACNPEIIGINNRNLRDFSVRLETSLELRKAIPADICVVAESGIHSVEDVRRVMDAGVDAILVGEALVTADDIPGKVRSLAWTEQSIVL